MATCYVTKQVVVMADGDDCCGMILRGYPTFLSLTYFLIDGQLSSVMFTGRTTPATSPRESYGFWDMTFSM